MIVTELPHIVLYRMECSGPTNLSIPVHGTVGNYLTASFRSETLEKSADSALGLDTQQVFNKCFVHFLFSS